MDILGGEHGDAAMAVLGVVPREEGAAEGGCGADIFEASGEAGMGLQGLELGFGEGVVVADLGAAERTGDAQVGKQLCGALAGHGRAAVGVQGKDLGLDALVEAGLLDEPAGQGGALALGEHPPNHVSAEDIEQHVQVEVSPALRSEQAGDIPRPSLVRGGGEQLGLGAARMGELTAPFACGPIRGQNPIHGAFRAQIVPFIE